MAGFGRRERLDVPRQVLATAPLARGEKLLAAARAGDESWLLGTRDAMYVVPGAGAEPGLRLPWEQIERADWDRNSDRLLVVEVGQYGERRPEHVITIGEPGLLLDMIRERVTASVVLQRRIAVRGRLGFWVIARRPPRGDGAITWAYEFDPGVDPGDDAVREAAQAALASAQSELGL